MLKVGFIGLGEQGKPMAINLARAGFDLMVHDLRKEPVDELVAVGAKAATTAREVATHSNIVEVVVVDDAEVESVVLGDNGIAAGARPGSIVAIHSTIRPSTIRKLGDAFATLDIGLIDAPISGGPHGAKARSMCYMVGGERDLLERCRPVFETSGKNIFHLGPLGSGMVAKLAHQVIICLNVLASLEGMTLARKAGLDLECMQEVVRAGGAQSRMADNWVKHKPPRSAGVLWEKDLMLALECADELGLSMPATAMARQLIKRVLNDE